jgi:hypothetical protein
MLLYLEIILTIAAWRRGFRMLALLPMGFAFLTGCMIGASSPELANGDNVFNFIWIDIISIIILGIMVAAGNEKTTEPKTEENPNLFHQGNELPEH